MKIFRIFASLVVAAGLVWACDTPEMNLIQDSQAAISPR